MPSQCSLAFRELGFLFIIATALSVCPTPQTAIAADPPNILFIAIDDLNHWVGHLGRNRQTQTPEIDRLAASGVSFSRAYCTAPACNPSRASLMSGQRPSTTGCYLNEQNWHPGISAEKLLNSYFQSHGYNTFGTGKIYHGGYANGGSWTEFHKTTGSPRKHPDAKDNGVGGIQFYPLANPDEEMPDYDAVSYGIEKLSQRHDKPFFLAVGLVKPHMPFSVPKKWFDQFPVDSIEVPPWREDDLNDVPPSGIKMAKPNSDHAQILKSGRWKEAVQAYLATIAFADSQVGRLVNALDASPHRDNTVIVLWSDHGWSLGEKSHWRKFALWEEPTRSVMIWRAPGVTPANKICERTIDFSAIYPTLCDLAAIAKPSHLDGDSIVSLLRDPGASWDRPAITTHGRLNHAVRSEKYRYIRYENGDQELYDTVADPLEYTNLADSEEFKQVIVGHSQWLPEMNADNLPSSKPGPASKRGAGQNNNQRRQQID